MPIYEYRCETCQHQMEVFASMSDPPPSSCDACGGGELTKVLFPVAVHYKGSGFYSTDYGGSRKTGATEGASDTTSPSTGGSGSTTSDSGSSSSSTGSGAASSGSGSSAD